MKDYLVTIDSKSNYRDLLITMEQGNVDNDFPKIFHADLKKLINFWKFDQMSISSFKSENFDSPIRGTNPRLVKNVESSFIKKLLGKNETTYNLEERSNKDILHGEDYANSNYFKLNKNYESIFMPKVGLNKAPVEHAIIEISTSETKYIPKSSIKIIEKSKYAIGFQNGRHRTRFLEFIGAKDIYILIPNSQLKWFEDNCKYEA